MNLIPTKTRLVKLTAKASRVGLTNIRRAATVLALLVLLTAQPPGAQAGLIAGESKILALSSFGGNQITVEDSQPLPIGPLAVSHQRTSPLGTQSYDIEGDAVFHSASSATVNLSLIRSATSTSNNVSMYADNTFTYNFTLTEPGAVKFDYDFTATTTDTNSFGGNFLPSIWWAMGRFEFGVDAQKTTFAMPSPADYPAPPSPITLIGTTTFEVAAGAHQIKILVGGGGATGDISADVRSMYGEVHFTIIPEPSSLAMLGMGAAWMAGLILRRKRRTAVSTPLKG